MAEATTPARDAGPLTQVDRDPSPEALAGWLYAAESDTGFKLHSRVLVKGSNHGVMSVVGFARVNPAGVDGSVRCVVVADPDHLRQQGPETCILYTPDRLKPAPPAPEAG